MYPSIYLDYAATTPVDPKVVEEIHKCLGWEGIHGNPSSNHCQGWQAACWIEEARQHLANLINSDPHEIIWTSGATEANNLAIKGIAHQQQSKGRHIITSKTEHKAVLDVCNALQKEGWDMTYLDVNKDGQVDIDKLAGALREDTVLVSLMHVNNETGSIQDIAAIGQLLRQRSHAVFHVDAAQSLGKIAIDLDSWDVDLMSFSAHKIYGPKGCGALYLRRKPRIRLQPQIHGGGQEQGLRAGTLATHQIVGMGEACRLIQLTMTDETRYISQLRDRLWAGLKDLPGIHLNSELTNSVAGILNVSFEGLHGESLRWAMRDIAVSSGSACDSANSEPSHVLRAMGRDPKLAASAIRFSLGRFTTAMEIDYTIRQLHQAVTRLRDLLPTH